jgi:NADPH:quinone reductase-like Zn-dependent oxidoreductase
LVAELREVVPAIAAHRINPVIDRAVGIDETAAAYAALAAGGQHAGKLAIAH